jgi:hypothetical protein
MGFGDNIDPRICPTFNDFTSHLQTAARAAFDAMRAETQREFYHTVENMIEEAVIAVRRQGWR